MQTVWMSCVSCAQPCSSVRANNRHAENKWPKEAACDRTDGAVCTGQLMQRTLVSCVAAHPCGEIQAIHNFMKNYQSLPKCCQRTRMPHYLACGLLQLLTSSVRGRARARASLHTGQPCERRVAGVSGREQVPWGAQHQRVGLSCVLQPRDRDRRDDTLQHRRCSRVLGSHGLQGRWGSLERGGGRWLSTWHP